MVNPRSGSAGSPPTPTIDAVRRRARHRLIGASVLVAVGVIGFPLLFDTQPRPIPVDIPIEIPSRNTPSPAAQPAAAPATAPVAGGKLPMITEEPEPAPKAEPARPSEAVAQAEKPARPEPAPASAPAAAPGPEPAPAPAPTPAAPPPAKPAATEAARAEALLKGQPDPKTAATGARLVVQVGAYAEDDRVREVRQKLERAGLKTYVHTANLPEGKRTRVRVGPFDNRADADKAAARIKALGLPAAVLTL